MPEPQNIGDSPMPKQTLLSKALAVRGGCGANTSKEGAALAVAWCYGEVTSKQVKIACEKANQSSIYCVLAQGVREAVRLGLLRREAK